MSSMEKSEILKAVGKKIKELREAKGLSQVDLVGKIEGNIDTTNIPAAARLHRVASNHRRCQ